MKFYLPVFVILFSAAGCSSPVEKAAAPVVAVNDPVTWVDNHTLHIKSIGSIPHPRRDPSTSRLIACQNAREAAIAIFHKRFLHHKKSDESYAGRKYNDDFHRFHMEISTVSKSNDEKGDCNMVMQFKGDDLKLKLTSAN